MNPAIRIVGERALLVSTDSPILLRAALLTAAEQAGLAVVEAVPAAATVLVQLASAGDLAALYDIVVSLADRPVAALGAGPVETNTDAVTVPVRFDGADLDWVAGSCGMQVNAVIETITESRLTAAFTGFAPGFAYLTGLPISLQLPRRSTPRTRVAAGSFAIADQYAAIYPQPSPGGWHLLGTTELVMFDPARNPIALIAPGARVRIQAIG